MKHIIKAKGVIKRVLFASKARRRELEEGVRKHASARGWIVESYFGGVPKDWRGDGVIGDYYDADEILSSGLDPSIPWVTNRDNPGLERHACVKGDVEAIAKMVVSYFASRGFKTFASFECFPMNGTVELLGEEALRLGAGFHVLYWQEEDPSLDLMSGFSRLVARLGRFLRELPKPCAVFGPGLNYVHPFYRACELEGLKVPQQLAFLCNNDDHETTCASDPASSAVIGEIHETGAKMVESLADLMEGRRPETKLVKPTAIVTRRSSDILAASHPGAADAIAFLHRNYMNAISVADAAAAAGISQSSVKQLLKREIGRSPGRLLFEIRMNRARELLKEGSRSVDEIAALTGYGSGMALSLAFKREYGTTPGAFRRSTSKEPDTPCLQG